MILKSMDLSSERLRLKDYEKAIQKSKDFEREILMSMDLVTAIPTD